MNQVENNDQLIKNLEKDAYRLYYKENPQGDARTCGLWKDILNAKKTEDPVEEIQKIICDVKAGLY